MCSRILLIWHPQDHMCQIIKYSRLLNKTKIVLSLYGYFLFLLLYLNCTTNQRNIPYGYLLQLLLQGCQGSFIIFYGIISEGPSYFHLMPLRIKIGPSVSIQDR